MRLCTKQNSTSHTCTCLAFHACLSRNTVNREAKLPIVRLEQAFSGSLIRAINQWQSRQTVGVRWLSSFLVESHFVWAGRQLLAALKIDGETFSAPWWWLIELIPVVNLLGFELDHTHTQTNFDHNLTGTYSLRASTSVSLYTMLLAHSVALGADLIVEWSAH